MPHKQDTKRPEYYFKFTTYGQKLQHSPQGDCPHVIHKKLKRQSKEVVETLTREHGYQLLPLQPF